MPVAYLHEGLVGVGEGGVHQVAHLSLVAVALSPLVNLGEGEEQLLLTRLGVDDVAFFHVGLYQLVAPPGEEHVLRAQTVVVGAAEVQVFEREEFLFLCRHGGEHEEMDE